MRIQVNLSDEMVSKVDSYARKMGVSRSSLCSMFIGQSIMNYDNSMDLLSLIGDRVSDSLVTSDKKEQ